MTEYSLNIYNLYPDMLNMYGDTGNVICIKKRLEWRGITCEIKEIGMGEKLDADDCDILLIGGSRTFEQENLIEDMKSVKATGIATCLANGTPILAVDGGYELFVKDYKTADGKLIEMTGIIDAHTIAKKERMTGNYMFSSSLDATGEAIPIVGFENHAGKTYLGVGVTPLGKILSGYGNNGEDGTEGARVNNLFATYSHGPVLPKNPKLCDKLIGLALEKKYGKDVLAELDAQCPLNNSFEQSASDYMSAKLAR